MTGRVHMCRRAALALAAGTIHRTKGGMAMRSSVGLTVNTLLAVGRASASPVLHMWIAHALWLVANAAGLSFVPHVQVRAAVQCGFAVVDIASRGGFMTKVSFVCCSQRAPRQVCHSKVIGAKLTTGLLA